MRAIAVCLLATVFTYLCPAAEPPKPDAKAACVRVWAVDTADGSSGSGTIVAGKNGKTYVITCNHIFSGRHDPRGGFVDTVYPQAAKVRANDRWYPGTALVGDRESDLAVIIVEGALTPAPLVATAPNLGAAVWRNGAGSGYQAGTVVAPENTLARFSLTVSGRAESGDSGAGYFTSAGELVGVHVGLDGRGRPRGTGIEFVKVILANKLVTGADVSVVKPIVARRAPAGKVIVAHLPAGRPLPDADGCVRNEAGEIIISYPLVPEWFDFQDPGDSDQEITRIGADGTATTKTVTVSGARWPGKDSGWVVVDGGPRTRR